MGQSVKFIRAFQFAFQGLVHLLATQWNARIHLLATIVVVGLGWWLGISRIEWAILLLTCTLVMSLEAINTAIEATVDLASPEIHPFAKTAKDVGAAAVLLAAIGAVIIGLLILLPPLRYKLGI